jgi:hypothetical protein
MPPVLSAPVQAVDNNDVEEGDDEENEEWGTPLCLVSDMHRGAVL